MGVGHSLDQRVELREGFEDRLALRPRRQVEHLRAREQVLQVERREAHRFGGSSLSAR
jgi:hypothetical protein